jgi:hypothetical protein
MKVFLSWSGSKSKAVAVHLRRWIPDVITMAEPWCATSDIDAGRRWSTEIAKALEGCHFGIVCLTASNLASPWILFEAGALAKRVSESRVVPYLIDIGPADLGLSPLSQFQAKRATEEDTLSLMQSIRDVAAELHYKKGVRLPEAEAVTRQIRRAWPELSRVLDALPEEPVRRPPEVPEILQNIFLALNSVGTRLDQLESKVLESPNKLYREIRLLLENYRPNVAVGPYASAHTRERLKKTLLGVEMPQAAREEWVEDKYVRDDDDEATPPFNKPHFDEEHSDVRRTGLDPLAPTPSEPVPGPPAHGGGIRDRQTRR